MQKLINGTAAAVLICVLTIGGCQNESASTTVSSSGDEASADNTAGSAESGNLGSDGSTPAASDELEIVDVDIETMAPDLSPGDPAPPVSIATWVQGTPVKAFEDGTVYVVEFWATWCGPCLQSMPHMSSLQESYGDKVRFIGVSDEDEATVSKFMERDSQLDKKWSEVLKYTIALDDQGTTNAAYMRAANQGGIPCAFVVGKTGRVEWIGHPLGMDEPLEQIVAGNWDRDAARETFIAEHAAEMVMQEINQLAGAGEFDQAIKISESLMAQFPGDGQSIYMHMQLLAAAKKKEDLRKLGEGLVEQYADDVQIMNLVAFMLANAGEPTDADLQVALKAGTQAAELTDNKEPEVLDTLAAVHYKSGDLESAIEIQKRAVAAAPGVKRLEEKLAKYEAETNESSAE